MRIFKSIVSEITESDENTIMNKIAGEMINIEAGRLLYKNGELIQYANQSKIPQYPVDITHDVRTTIHASFGVIYSPVAELDYFGDSLKNIVQMYDDKTPQYSLYNKAVLFEAHRTFTITKGRTNKGTTAINSEHPVKRNIIIPSHSDEYYHHLNMSAGLAQNRFVWFILPLSNLLDDIDNFQRRFMPIPVQIFSILYDRDDITIMVDGEKLDDNITFKHFRGCGNVIHTIDDSIILPLPPVKIPDKICPRCESEFSSQKKLQTHIREHQCQYKEDISIMERNFRTQVRYPELVPTWNDGVLDITWRIQYCYKRGITYDLYKYFPRANDLAIKYMYPEQGFPLVEQTYLPAIDEKITIHNTYAKSNTYFTHLGNMDTTYYTEKETIDTICVGCMVPLHGEIYVKLFHNLEGIAICPTCMHTSPDFYTTLNKSGQLLKIQYPRTVLEVIDDIKQSSLYGVGMCNIKLRKVLLKEVILCDWTQLVGNKTLMITPNGYIGWGGELSDYIHNIPHILRQYPEKRQLILTGKLFPLSIIKY